MSKKKILIVDDSQVVLKAMEMKLKASGYDVVLAVDASQAIAAARDQRPDLMLIDINFPAEMGVAWDGFRIIDWLKRSEAAKDTPFILITGDNVEKHTDKVAAAGAKAIFQKPMNPTALLAKIRECLGQEGPGNITLR
jgi:CheY-like chemotaxis protein